MWDILRKRVLGANRSDTNIIGFAGLGKSVIARVEVFAFLSNVGQLDVRDLRLNKSDLKLVLEKVFLIWQLAVETEHLLFFLGKRLHRQALVSFLW